MQLKTLVAAIPIRQVIGTLDRPVESIAYDSRRVQRNGLFVALRGEKTDGHEFIGSAIDKGASVIVTEREEQHPRVTCLVVENTRTALADLSANFYGHPARKLKLAAVTGTNGKTTTTFLIKHICEKAGLRCGLIGTVRYEIGNAFCLPFAQRRNRSIYRNCWHRSLTRVVGLPRWKFRRMRSRRIARAASNGTWLSLPISRRTISIFTGRWRATSIPRRSFSHNLAASGKSRSRLQL